MPEGNGIGNLRQRQVDAGFDEFLESVSQRSSLGERDVQCLFPEEWSLAESEPGQAKRPLSVERGGPCEGHACVARLLTPLKHTCNGRTVSNGVVKAWYHRRILRKH